jgi:hypothetical protein
MPKVFRKNQLRTLITNTGVYVLCDLDAVPIYVGQSIDSIRARVSRHLTSARSDVIANRQIDVWEVAYVWGWSAEGREKINALEASIFHYYDPRSTLMNGSIPPINQGTVGAPLDPTQVVQMIDDAEIARRKDPDRRLPRQIEHYQRLVDHILNVKDSPQLRRSLGAHYERLTKYHHSFLRLAEPEVFGSDDQDDQVD